MNVSTHAIRRYAERVMNIQIPEYLTDAGAMTHLRSLCYNIDDIERQIAQAVSPHVVAGQSGSYAFGAWRVIMRNGTLASIVPIATPDEWAAKKRNRNKEGRVRAMENESYA